MHVRASGEEASLKRAEARSTDRRDRLEPLRARRWERSSTSGRPRSPARRSSPRTSPAHRRIRMRSFTLSSPALALEAGLRIDGLSSRRRAQRAAQAACEARSTIASKSLVMAGIGLGRAEDRGPGSRSGPKSASPDRCGGGRLRAATPRRPWARFISPRRCRGR